MEAWFWLKKRKKEMNGCSLCFLCCVKRARITLYYTCLSSLTAQRRTRTHSRQTRIWLVIVLFTLSFVRLQWTSEEREAWNEQRTKQTHNEPLTSDWTNEGWTKGNKERRVRFTYHSFFISLRSSFHSSPSFFSLSAPFIHIINERKRNRKRTQL